MIEFVPGLVLVLALLLCAETRALVRKECIAMSARLDDLEEAHAAIARPHIEAN